jgi:hypothetical protein
LPTPGARNGRRKQPIPSVASAGLVPARFLGETKTGRPQGAPLHPPLHCARRAPTVDAPDSADPKRGRGGPCVRPVPRRNENRAPTRGAPTSAPALRTPGARNGRRKQPIPSVAAAGLVTARFLGETKTGRPQGAPLHPPLHCVRRAPAIGDENSQSRPR